MGYSNVALPGAIFNAINDLLEQADPEGNIIDFEMECELAEKVISAFEDADYDCLDELSGISDAVDFVLSKRIEE
jgi:hypothetical protein